MSTSTTHNKFVWLAALVLLSLNAQAQNYRIKVEHADQVSYSPESNPPTTRYGVIDLQKDLNLPFYLDPLYLTNSGYVLLRDGEYNYRWHNGQIEDMGQFNAFMDMLEDGTLVPEPPNDNQHPLDVWKTRNGVSIGGGFITFGTGQFMNKINGQQMPFYAFDVNSQGLVLAQDNQSAFFFYDFLRSGPTTPFLPFPTDDPYPFTLNHHTFSLIDESGATTNVLAPQVVGTNYGWAKATIWEQDPVTRQYSAKYLNQSIAADSGWDLQYAYGINDAGMITCVGTFQGMQRPCLLWPIKVKILQPNSNDELPESQVLLFDDELAVDIEIAEGPGLDTLVHVTQQFGDHITIRTSGTKPAGTDLPINGSTATLLIQNDKVVIRIRGLSRAQLVQMNLLPQQDEDNVHEKAWYDTGSDSPAAASNLTDGLAFEAFESGVSRGRSTYSGHLSSETPNCPIDPQFPSKTFMAAAGAEILSVTYGAAQSEKRMIANQADTFYFSGHGEYGESAFNLTGQNVGDHFFHASDAQWTHELKTVMASGCSVFGIRNDKYRAKSMTTRNRWYYRLVYQVMTNFSPDASPGEQWENIAPALKLGYNFSAPRDNTGTANIISNYYAALAAGMSPVQAWGRANGEGSPGNNACALDTSVTPHEYWYFRRFGAGRIWTKVVKGGSGW